MSLMKQVRERFCFEFDGWTTAETAAETVTKHEANEAIVGAVEWALGIVANEVARLAGKR